jgi:hypothetical protein
MLLSEWNISSSQIYEAKKSFLREHNVSFELKSRS